MEIFVHATLTRAAKLPAISTSMRRWPGDHRDDGGTLRWSRPTPGMGTMPPRAPTPAGWCTWIARHGCGPLPVRSPARSSASWTAVV